MGKGKGEDMGAEVAGLRRFLMAVGALPCETFLRRPWITAGALPEDTAVADLAGLEYDP